MFSEDKETEQVVRWWVSSAVTTLAILVAAGMYGCPIYSVYSARQEGAAEMAKATQNRSIRIAEAEANAKAATLQAEATIAQAKAKATAHIAEAQGVAEANRIIGASLHDNPEYLKYVYLTSLDKSSTMYVPTEGGFPIFLQNMPPRMMEKK